MPADGSDFALCELTYYHLWHNIRGVGRVSNEHTTVLVPDGYYNAHKFDKEVFKTLGAKLHLDTHIGLLQLTTKNDNIVISSEFSSVLGFSQNTFEGAKMLLRNGLTTSGATYTADKPHTLAVHREVYIHLAELSTSQNLTNGQPSTLLRSIPVENEKRGAWRTISFQVLQYKRLAAGPISQLDISLRDSKRKRLPFEYYSICCISEMVDAGGPGTVRKCPGVVLAKLGDVEGFDRSGTEDQLYAFQLSDGVYKSKKFIPSEGIGSLKFEELSDVDISHAVPRRLHSLAYTRCKWVAFADPSNKLVGSST